MKTHWISTCMVAGMAAAVSVQTATAQESVEAFFKGKQMSMLIGYAPGGGYDTYARTLARHMPGHLPGKPNIVPRNMPGAGSLIAVNFLVNSAPNDGSHLAAVGREVPTAALFGTKNIRFNTDELNWIGNLVSTETFCGAWHTSGFESAQDLFDKSLIVGGTNGASITVKAPLALNNLLGTKLKLIAGYPGGAAMHLALERGEIQGRCAWTYSSMLTTGQDWIKEGKVKVLLMLSLDRSKQFPDVPTAAELAKTDEARQALELILSPDIIARPYVAPPGVPAGRLAALRTAFDATAADPAFVAAMEKQKQELSPMSGPDMEKIIRRLYKTPKSVVELAVKATKDTGKTEMKMVEIPLETVKGAIEGVANGGREVSYQASSKKGKLKVSSSGTKVTIGGKEAKRKELKAGMNCEFSFKGSAAKSIACQ